MHLSRTIAATCLVTPLLISNTSYADLYKCTVNGNASYQDTPCTHQNETGKTGVNVESIDGCFEAQVPYGGQNGSPTTKLKVVRAGEHSSVMSLTAAYFHTTYYTTYNRFNRSMPIRQVQSITYSPGSLTLKNADKDELASMSKISGYQLSHGLSTGTPWNNPDIHQHPKGIYQGTDQNNRSIFYASLPNGLGKAEKIICPQ